MVLRNLQPILARGVECVAHREVGALEDLLFLFCILMGAFVYAYNDLQFSAPGYLWAFLHIVSMTVRLHQKVRELVAARPNLRSKPQ